MIGALIRDTLKLLLRGKALFMLVLSALLGGLFVRAVVEMGGERLSGSEIAGAALETFSGTLFLMSVITGLCLGLVLAGQDRATSFLSMIAVRPVGRAVFVLGRLVGLCLTTVAATVLLAVVMALPSGLTMEQIPELRERIRAERVVVGDRVLDRGEVAQAAVGVPARFEFGEEAVPVASLYLIPKVPVGSDFNGMVDFIVRCIPDDQGVPQVYQSGSIRPLREVPLRFDIPESSSFVLEVVPANRSFTLEVSQDVLTTDGGEVARFQGLLMGLFLVCVASVIVSFLAYFMASALSAGPASLAASFVTLVALGRDGVLDIVSGIGRGDVSSNGEQGHFLANWTREGLDVLVRLVPDLENFNPSASLGLGEFIPPAVAFSSLLPLLLLMMGLFLAAVAVLPLRER